MALPALYVWLLSYVFRPKLKNFSNLSLRPPGGPGLCFSYTGVVVSVIFYLSDGFHYSRPFHPEQP